MESSRRKDILKEAGLDHSKERENIEKAIKSELKRQEKVQDKKDKLMKGTMFSSMTKVRKVMDDWMLDPIIGFCLPEVGDIISAVLVIPFIYFSLFKVKSLRLACACAFNTLVDMIIGLIPIIGDITDIFHKSYKKNLQLITDYVDDKAEAKREVNTKFMWVWVVLIAYIGFLYGVGRFYYNVFQYIKDLFN